MVLSFGQAVAWGGRRVRPRDACPRPRRARPEKDDPRRRGQPPAAARRSEARDAPRRRAVRRRGDARRRGRRAAAAQRQRPQGQHDAPRRGGQRRGRDPRRRRRLQGDPRPHRGRAAAGQRRAQADPPRSHLRRRARAREHRRLVAHAAGVGNFIRLDMEESAFVDATLRVYRSLREEGHDNVGTVLQSYLYRTPADLEDLLRSSRTCGWSRAPTWSPQQVAYPEKSDVDAAYARLIERSLTAGGSPRSQPTTSRSSTTRCRSPTTTASRGRASSSRCSTASGASCSSLSSRQGYDVLVATPFGPDWYRYLMRRLAERPANVLFIARNLVRR